MAQDFRTPLKKDRGSSAQGHTQELALPSVILSAARGFSFEVIRAKVLLTNGLRKADRPAYCKQRMTILEHSLSPHADTLPSEALSNAPMHPECRHTTTADIDSTNLVHESDAVDVQPRPRSAKTSQTGSPSS